MRRRELILGIGGAVAARHAARAQSAPGMPVIGFLNSQSPGPFADLVAAFRKGLRHEDYVEGQNLTIEYRWAEGDKSRLAALAADLVRRGVSVIATGGGPNPALAAKAATGTIPIVFNIGGDPVRLGLVESLGRPGGNITGAVILTSELDGKRLELLHQLAPKSGRVAVLFNPRNPNLEKQLRDVTEAARKLGEPITILRAASDGEIDAALSPPRIGEAGAMLVGADPFFLSRRDHIVELVARLRLPAIYELRPFVLAGGLMSYGTSLVDGYHQVGVYVGKILSGAKPANLPVVQSSRFELVINLNTAKALGITVPPMLSAGADEVIE